MLTFTSTGHYKNENKKLKVQVLPEWLIFIIYNTETVTIQSK